MLDINDFIKSVNIIEDRIVRFDYIVHKGVKLPRGKNGNRFRFSTGIRLSDTVIKTLKSDNMKKAFEKAYEHYLSLMDTVENKDNLLFEDIAHDALAEAESNRTKTDGTRDYLNILNKDILPVYGKIPLIDFKIKTIKAFQVYLGKQNLSQSRANTKWYVMKRVLDYAVENEYIATNPLNKVNRNSKLFSKPKVEEVEYFSKEEMRFILDDKCEGCTEKEYEKYKLMRIFLKVAFFSGARTGEITSLKWDNILFSENKIIFATSIRKSSLGPTKTDRIRSVPMVKELADALLKYKGTSNHEYVFRNPSTGGIYRDTRSIVDTYYKPMLERLKLPYILLYHTRRTFASLAMEQGIPLSTISNCLGHKSTDITSRYYIKHSRSNDDLIKSQLESLSA